MNATADRQNRDAGSAIGHDGRHHIVRSDTAHRTSQTGLQFRSVIPGNLSKKDVVFGMDAFPDGEMEQEFVKDHNNTGDNGNTVMEAMARQHFLRRHALDSKYLTAGEEIDLEIEQSLFAALEKSNLSHALVVIVVGEAEAELLCNPCNYIDSTR
ncbi:hypothetical protein [Agrobacterium pusense]|uniref:hypothetical protein n=1 Tax=Agrobacterium pusense TaxID=648995 RepID=UPI00286B5F62|nr:hypothetical protein [Agrobacterium pusense]